MAPDANSIANASMGSVTRKLASANALKDSLEQIVPQTVHRGHMETLVNESVHHVEISIAPNKLESASAHWEPKEHHVIRLVTPTHLDTSVNPL